MGYILSIFFLTLQKKRMMIMQKMLCYILSSVFLLAILSSCEVEDNSPRLSDLAGNTYIGNSDLDLDIGGRGVFVANSNEKSDGAIIEYLDAVTDNLIITLTDAQIKGEGLLFSPVPVDVDAVFTLTVDSLKENEENDGAIRFVLANTGSLDLIVGKGSGALSIENLDLNFVNTTRATDEGIELTTSADLTVDETGAILSTLSSIISGDGQTQALSVGITLVLSSIAVGELPDPPADPTLADLAGDYTGDSNLGLRVPPAIGVVSSGTDDGADLVFKDAGADNLVITLTNNRLAIEGNSTVGVDGVFTFTIDNLIIENNDIEFDIGTTGSVDLTVGSGTPITGLALTEVNATIAGASVITLTATVTLTEVQANNILGGFNAGVIVSGGKEANISLTVDNIAEDDS